MKKAQIAADKLNENPDLSAMTLLEDEGAIDGVDEEGEMVGVFSDDSRLYMSDGIWFAL